MNEFAIFPSISFLIAVFAILKVLKLDISLLTKVLVVSSVSATFMTIMIILAEQLFLLLYYANFLCVPIAIFLLTYLSLSLFPNFLRHQTTLRTLILLCQVRKLVCLTPSLKGANDFFGFLFRELKG